MQKNYFLQYNVKKAVIHRITNLIIISVIFLSSCLFIPNFNDINRTSGESFQLPSMADIDSHLFEGNENALNITDYGNLYEYNQEITLTNQENLNITYYIDDIHDWEVSKIETQIKDIQDTRNWINNSVFQPIQIFRKYQSFESAHDYSNNNDPYVDIDHTISEIGAYYLRVHFVNMSFDYQNDATDSDFMVVLNGSQNEVFAASGFREDFYSPWSTGDIIYLSYSSDNNPSTRDYGYYIDYYEILNASSNLELNSVNWKGRYAKNELYGLNTYGSGNIGNADGMFIGYHGSWYGDLETYVFYENTFTEVYQDDINVPRGKVIDAYLSFDYYTQFALDTNNIIMYMKINGEKVYSKGLLDLNSVGKNIWHHTNKVPMYLWINQTNIFTTGNINDQALNISIGIRNEGSSTIYSGYEDGNANVIWIDNVSLVISTIANSTQDGINLRINSIDLIEKNEWGKADLNLTDCWGIDPIVLNFSTNSPSLCFNLDTTLFGYRETLSKLDQQNNDGLNYYLLDNGTVIWEFYHNLYMPNEYTDFEFLVDKPKNWKILSVLDPTFLPMSYEGGNVGDDYLLLNKTSASYPGWWKFLATSPNYIQEENIDVSRNGQWGFSDFRTGNTGQIKAQINYSSEVPNILDQTIANLTVYDPKGNVWFEDSAVPLVNGTVIFSSFNIATHNSTGGIHNFTVFWGNGTSIGGCKSNFVITHGSYMTLLRPDDAKLDNSTGGSVGDIIPLRIYLRDSENDNPISNALLSFNWTSGSITMVEIGLGIYDGILDTSDIGALGLYTIIVSSYKIGYENSTFNLLINLGEDTGLQRLGSDSSIIINSNTTITFRYYSVVDDDSITGATININITNPIYYSITETSPGTYSIKINTAFLNIIGTYQLLFEFSAPGYEPQFHIYQFQIVNPPLPAGSNPFLVLIIIISIAVISVLGSLSIRSYILLPRKRRKEADLLSRTQRFKDMKNVQAIVISHRLSGIPLYTKSYSLLEKQKKELFSGFIQAITAIGEEIAGKRITSDGNNVKKTAGGIERLIELDFKYFYCLICDREEIRIVLVLQDRASEQLKEVITNLATSIVLTHSHILENWDGSIQIFEKEMPSIIDQYFNFFYKEGFILNNPQYIATMKKEMLFSKMESRILNTIYSIAKNKSEFFLEDVVQTVHEDNKDLIIDSIEGLLDKKIIISKIN